MAGGSRSPAIFFWSNIYNNFLIKIIFNIKSKKEVTVMSVTNEIQQSILEAMKLLSKKAADSTNATLTVKCAVTKVV